MVCGHLLDLLQPEIEAHDTPTEIYMIRKPYTLETNMMWFIGLMTHDGDINI